MIAQIASFGRTASTPGLMARAVTPAAVAPTLRDRPQPAPRPHVASTVALAPAAMTALIEAQERLADNAPRLVRQHVAQKLDHLIAQLDDGAPTAAGTGAPFNVRQLQVVRDALSQEPAFPGSIDLQA